MEKKDKKIKLIFRTEYGPMYHTGDFSYEYEAEDIHSEMTNEIDYINKENKGLFKIIGWNYNIGQNALKNYLQLTILTTNAKKRKTIKILDNSYDYSWKLKDKSRIWKI